MSLYQSTNHFGSMVVVQPPVCSDLLRATVRDLRSLRTQENDAWIEFVRDFRFSTRSFPLLNAIMVEWRDEGARICLSMGVGDRSLHQMSSNHAEVEVMFSQMMPYQYSPAKAMRDTILRLIQHEADESFYEAGIRTFDPHAGDSFRLCPDVDPVK